VYNGAETVVEAIESVLRENLSDSEVIVVNDGSTDSTAQLIERYKPAVNVIHRENGGLCVARNTALRQASGEFIALLDADDVWLPGRLRLTVAALEQNSEAAVAFCDFRPLDPANNLLEPSCAGRAPSRRDLQENGWPIIPSATTIRRSALDKVGGFCEEFTGCAGGEDAYLWLLLSETNSFAYVPEALVIHRRTSPADTIAKYEPGRKTFERLVRARYGKAADGVLRESERYFGTLAFAGAIEELDQQRFLRAAALLCRAMVYRPGLLFDPRLLLRLFRSRNIRRLARLFVRLPQRSLPIKDHAASHQTP